eukprot:scaffold84714_cov39-Phaeocystis_antarctica.AAC.1
MGRDALIATYALVAAVLAAAWGAEPASARRGTPRHSGLTLAARSAERRSSCWLAVRRAHG